MKKKMTEKKAMLFRFEHLVKLIDDIKSEKLKLIKCDLETFREALETFSVDGYKRFAPFPELEMKIYIVVNEDNEGAGSSYIIKGVCSDKKKAEYMKEIFQAEDILEFKLDKGISKANANLFPYRVATEEEKQLRSRIKILEEGIKVLNEANRNWKNAYSNLCDFAVKSGLDITTRGRVK